MAPNLTVWMKGVSLEMQLCRLPARAGSARRYRSTDLCHFVARETKLASELGPAFRVIVRIAIDDPTRSRLSDLFYIDNARTIKFRSRTICNIIEAIVFTRAAFTS